MAETQPAVAASPETVFLDFADWRTKAVQDRASVEGMGVSWSMPGQEVRAALDVPPEQADYVLDFVITTEERDRYGDTIALDGWDWANYFKGGAGVVLLNHDRRGLAMGKSPWIKQMGPALVGRCQFPTQAECGYEEDQPSLHKTVRLLYVNGFMKSTSVGLLPIDWTFNDQTGGIKFITQEGLEWSLVSVPANSSCNQLAKSAGIDLSPLREYAMRSLDMIAGVEGVYVTKSRLERALKDLGSEKGIAYFDLGELTLAKQSTPERAAPVVTEKKGAGRVVKALEAAGLTLDDLVAAAKAAKTQPVAAAAEERSAVDAEVVSESYLEIADSVPSEELLLVDGDGKAVELTTESFALMVREALTDAANEQQTRVTGKVF